MIRVITAIIVALAAINAQAVGYSYGQGSTASQSQTASQSYGVVVNNGYALQGTQSGAANSSGVHVNATGGAAHGVDLDTYSVGYTYSYNQGIQGGNAYGTTAGTAYQGGYGTAWGYAVDWAF